MQFTKLFKQAENTLEHALNQKYKAIIKTDKEDQIITEQEYFKRKLRFYHSVFEPEVVDKQHMPMYEIKFYKGTKTIT